MKRPTPAQRALILRLLRENELDARTVTYQHRPLGISDHEIGGSVDSWLDTLSIEGAGQVIDKLKGMLS